MAIQDLTASLDLKQNLNIYATCKQFDDLNLILTIWDNSVQADLTNYDARLRAMKSDQVPLIQYHVGITINGNVVDIKADSQLTTTSGKTLVELQFINKSTGEKKATFNLVLIVVPSTLEVDGSISTATYTLLEELENKIDQGTDYFQNLTNFIEQHPDMPILDDRVTTLENETDINSNNIKNERLARILDFTFDGFIPAQNSNRHLQSLCYIPEDNVLLVAYNDTTSETSELGDLVKFDMTTKSVIQVYSNVSIYHANDMTYNPNTKEILITAMYDADGKNIIYVYDYNTMAKKSEIALSGVGVDSYIVGIAYNADKNNYVAYTGEIIYIYDSSFALLSQFNASRNGLIIQGIEICNDLIFLTFMNQLWVYDYSGNKVRNYYVDRVGETEGIAYIGNDNFVIGNEINYSAIALNSCRTFIFNILKDFDEYVWHTYKTLEEIGILTGTENIDAICNALPNNSKLIYDKVVANTSTIYPTTSGTVEITKKDISKINFKFYNGLDMTKPYIYNGSYNGNLTPAWSGWKQLALNDDVKVFSSLADIGLTSADMTTDFSANVLKIITAMGRNRKIILYPYSTESNTNLYNSVKTWCGVNTDAYKLIIESAPTTDATISSSKVEVYPNTADGNNKFLFGFYDNSLGTCREFLTGSDSGWLDLPLASGITSAAGYTCQYRKIGNLVKFRGLITGITTTGTIATLPSGFRPSLVSMAILPKSTDDATYGKFAVAIDGSLLYKGCSTTLASSFGFDLGGISYFVN